MASERIILDTNLWISFLISKNFDQLDELIKTQRVTLVFSNELIEEFVDVATRPKFKKYFSKSDVKKILSNFDHFGEMHSVTSDLQICRDEKDNFLLNLAVDSKANYLVTGDKDLLILERIENTEILSFAEFMKREF